ncbi:MAG TPA: FRG domain-containing protein [Candidatus Binatia bacterium]
METEIPGHDIVWRGQRLASWSLESSLDRLARTLGLQQDADLRDRHRSEFLYAIRGRRGENPVELKAEQDVFALGQHQGLVTPLVDWTAAPFAALFFAFAEDHVKGERTHRAVFGLDRTVVEEYCNAKFKTNPAPQLQFYRPITNDNPRLVSQCGLFTLAPTGKTIEQWLAEHFKGDSVPVLTKYSIPGTDRPEVLKALHRMNINHLSLFPDLYGASMFCNLRLELSR